MRSCLTLLRETFRASIAAINTVAIGVSLFLVGLALSGSTDAGFRYDILYGLMFSTWTIVPVANLIAIFGGSYSKRKLHLLAYGGNTVLLVVGIHSILVGPPVTCGPIGVTLLMMFAITNIVAVATSTRFRQLGEEEKASEIGRGEKTA
jgi:hypothetical protein